MSETFVDFDFTQLSIAEDKTNGAVGNIIFSAKELNSIILV